MAKSKNKTPASPCSTFRHLPLAQHPTRQQPNNQETTRKATTTTTTRSLSYTAKAASSSAANPIQPRLTVLSGARATSNHPTYTNRSSRILLLRYISPHIDSLVVNFNHDRPAKTNSCCPETVLEVTSIGDKYRQAYMGLYCMCSSGVLQPVRDTDRTGCTLLFAFMVGLTQSVFLHNNDQAATRAFRRS